MFLLRLTPVYPARTNRFSTLPRAGAYFPVWLRLYISRIFFAPHAGCNFFIRSISTLTGSGMLRLLVNGFLECSSRPAYPSSRNLCFHLYPHLVLIPYSRHSSVNTTLSSSAFRT